jgi:hypothetical protein
MKTRNHIQINFARLVKRRNNGQEEILKQDASITSLKKDVTMRLKELRRFMLMERIRKR